MGENYLDLALIDEGRQQLRFRRVDLREIGTGSREGAKVADPGVIAELAERIEGQAPRLARGSIAIIDSPPWPRDRVGSGTGWAAREGEVTDRAIDQILRAMMRELRRAGAVATGLAMFPTPRLDYFSGQIAAPACKPHLRTLARELFGPPGEAIGASGGGTFTRFMLAGFATYRALGMIGVTCYEGYPDLQFRLRSGNLPLPSKMKSRDKTAVMANRRRMVSDQADMLGIKVGEEVRTLDQADAAILALSVVAAERGDVGIVIKHPAEGCFWLTLSTAAAQLISTDNDWKLGPRDEEQEGANA